MLFFAKKEGVNMGFFRSVGKGVGVVGGKLIGGTTKIVGKAVGTKFQGTGEWLEEIGDGIEKSSVVALDNFGQFLDGTAEATYGVIKKDPSNKENGLENMKESAKRTAKGVGYSMKYTAENTRKTVSGLVNGDHDKALEGVKTSEK